MEEIETKNAIITHTQLGEEDHGIFVATICFDYGGTQQCLNGWALDTYDKKLEKRIGIVEGMKFIIEFMKVIEVRYWENIKGTHVRVECSHKEIYKVGHILKDKWFDPKDVYKDLIKEE